MYVHWLGILRVAGVRDGIKYAGEYRDKNLFNCLVARVTCPCCFSSIINYAMLNVQCEFSGL